MITQLGRLDPQHLGLIGRSSVMRYQHDGKQLGEIGKQLGVQYLLEGSVRREASKVRITAQLIRTKDQTHMWSHAYDRELSSLLEVQSEIAEEIAREIKLTLAEGKDERTATARRLSGKAYEAYDFHLEGRYFWNKRTPEGFQRAAEYFRRSIEKDPTYARAYAELADSYALMSSYNLVAPKEAMPKARVAAQTAIRLDERLPEAHKRHWQ
jgi:hypothetical protein